LGNHRRQFEQSWLELGLGLSRSLKGQTIWIADAHCGDGKRYAVHADDILTAFLELESAIRDHLLDAADYQCFRVCFRAAS
jgi:hypothetical protein